MSDNLAFFQPPEILSDSLKQKRERGRRGVARQRLVRVDKTRVFPPPPPPQRNLELLLTYCQQTCC